MNYSTLEFNNSICLFSSYSLSTEISRYVEVYLLELKKYFTKVVFIYNERLLNDYSIDWLIKNDIEAFAVQNEGFDFGMWYKGFQKYDVSRYNYLGLVNDSCILFKPLFELLDWINKSNASYTGVVSSARFGYHIQSFFLLIKKPAIQTVIEYFNSNGIPVSYKEAIETYELGLPKYLVSKDITCEAFMERYTLNSRYNPSFFQLKTLLNNGMPMIKKKIIFRSYRPLEYIGLQMMRFNIDGNFYALYIDQMIDSKNHLLNVSSTIPLDKFNNRLDITIYDRLLIITNRLRKYSIFRYSYNAGVFVKRLIFK